MKKEIERLIKKNERLEKQIRREHRILMCLSVVCFVQIVINIIYL